MLSREEEAELVRSNKKVKDIHHAEFNGAVREVPPIDNLHPDPLTRASFKDKLIREIPGAYAETFDLIDQMEEDMEAKEEIEDNKDLIGPGRVAVKLSRDTKTRIRGAWSKAIIIKLVRRTVGLAICKASCFSCGDQ